MQLALAEEISLKEPRASLQVAWMSPLKKKVSANQLIEVVAFRDLRRWVRENKPSTQRILHYLGLIPSKKNRFWWLLPRRFEARDYKIAVFDVPRTALCRPLYDHKPGQKKAGVATCIQKHVKPINKRATDGFNGLGFSVDTKTNMRALEVYRITWRDAVSKGFCVLPLSRFLSDA